MVVEAIYLETIDWMHSANFYHGLSEYFGNLKVDPVNKAILWDPSKDRLPRIIIRQVAPGTESVVGIGGRISFSVDDVDAVDRAHECLMSLGAREIEGPKWLGGFYAVRYSDPDGHRFEIATYI